MLIEREPSFVSHAFLSWSYILSEKGINTKGKKLLKSRKLGQRKLSFKKKTRHHFQKQHIFNFIFKLKRTFISTLDLWLFIVNLIFIDEQIIFIMARLKIW